MTRPSIQKFGAATLLALLVSGTSPAAAELDLASARVHELDNGLTVVLLIDRHFPVVSTQMLYRAGARNEISGKTGLAHFLEHMAFRDSEQFPDTDLVSEIYAAGGEWHGYTWLDQTTYYATAPKEQVDLLLRVEADRMLRLTLPPDKLVAERGAVLAELHLYENSPASELLDALMLAAFVAHPYRNNTIGWQSDIENLEHADVVEFYRRHYHAANAVLAVVGDFDSAAVLERVTELFAASPARPPTALPHTIEPRQTGERRVILHGDILTPEFMIGYRAPSVHDPDYPAFLVVQELLGTGSGVNFLQNDWGTVTRQGDLLHDAAPKVTTWYPPSEQEFLFVIGGGVERASQMSGTELEVERRIAPLRNQKVDENAIAMARASVLDALVFDVETTEDAAHQLAFFTGMHALDVLLRLPRAVAAVRAADVQRAAARYLEPEQRTIAWYLPQPADSSVAAEHASPLMSVEPDPVAMTHVATQPVAAPQVQTLSGGLVAIVQASDLSDSVQLELVLRGTGLTGADTLTAGPVDGYSSLEWQVRPEQLAAAIAAAPGALAALQRTGNSKQPSARDPATRLEEAFAAIMNARRSNSATAVRPALVLVSGAIDSGATLEWLEQSFGSLPVAAQAQDASGRGEASDEVIHLGYAISQAQLGYIVPAAPPAERAHDAWRLLLYILSHDYEGRLGKAAISNRGLAYYIDNRYRSNGQSAWVSLSIGVDVDKTEALRALLKAELLGLREHPPTLAEIDEAKRYFVGRARSAAQSNAELNDAHARDWLWYGDAVTPEALDERLALITREDVIRIIPAFIDGTTILVTH